MKYFSLRFSATVAHHRFKTFCFNTYVKLHKIFDNQEHNYACDYYPAKNNPFVLQKSLKYLENVLPYINCGRQKYFITKLHNVTKFMMTFLTVLMKCPNSKVFIK